MNPFDLWLAHLYSQVKAMLTPFTISTLTNSTSPSLTVRPYLFPRRLDMIGGFC